MIIRMMRGIISDMMSWAPLSRPFVDGFIDIIERPIFSIHTDLDTIVLQHAKKCL